MYEVQLFRKALKAYAQAQRPLARKLARCFEVLEQTPHRHPNIKRLKGPYHGLLRDRVGFGKDGRTKRRQSRRLLVVRNITLCSCLMFSG